MHHRYAPKLTKMHHNPIMSTSANPSKTELGVEQEAGPVPSNMAMSATPAAWSTAGSWPRREVDGVQPDAGIARSNDMWTIRPTRRTVRTTGLHRAARAVPRRMAKSAKEADANFAPWEEGLAAMGAPTSKGRPRPPGAILVVCSLGYRGCEL